MTVNLDELIGVVDSLVATKTQRSLRDVEILVLRGSWDNKTYEDIAENHNYTPQYIKQDVGPRLWKLLSDALGERVSKTNFRRALERVWQANLGHRSETGGNIRESLGLPPLDDNDLIGEENSTRWSTGLRPSPRDDQRPSPQSSMLDDIESHRVTQLALTERCDWADSAEVAQFYGRQAEYDTLVAWLTHDRCRLVSVVGMGGIGKTTLTLRVAHAIQAEFDFIIWRSLRDAPPLADLLHDITKFLSRQQEIELPAVPEEQLLRLLHYLQTHRCLIILDNLESVLASKTMAGAYLTGYENYGDCLRALGEVEHQSTILITSREKISEVSVFEGQALPVRSMPLQGLSYQAAREIFTAAKCYGISDREWRYITDHYGGNPLALKILAAAIQDLAGGDASELMSFLQRGFLQFRDLSDILARQFNRLSPAEQQVLYWLAINREPLTLADLTQDILVSEGSPHSLAETLQSLVRRSMIERQGNRLLLQPAVLEYVTQRFVLGVSEDLINQQLGMLSRYALVKATSQDYVKSAQHRFILQPLQEELLAYFGNQRLLVNQLSQMVAVLQRTGESGPSYAAGNLLNLLRSLEVELSGLDLSGLTVWQADLVEAKLVQMNLRETDLSKSVFTSVLNASLSVAFSPNGRSLAIGNGDSRLRIRDTVDFKERCICQGHSNWVAAVVYSPDGSRVASGSLDQSIKLWDGETGKCLQTLTGHQGWVWSVAFSPDGQRLASGSLDQTVRLWSVATGECTQVLTQEAGWVWSVAFSPDGRWLATGGDDQRVRLWDLETGDCLRDMGGHTGRVSCVAFSRDGQLIASASFDQTVKIWEARSGNCLRTLANHSHTVLSVAFAPLQDEVVGDDCCPTLLASAGQDFTVRLWDYLTGQCLKTLQGHPSGVWSVAFDPTGRYLASCSNDSTVKLWNVQTGQSLRTIQGYSAGIKAIATPPTPSGLIATAGDDEIVKLWDLQTGSCVHRLRGHSRWIRGVALSPNGQLVASSGNDGSVRVWEIQSQSLHRVFREHQNMVYTVTFSPDGAYLTSGSDDQTLRIWELATTAPAQVLEVGARVWSVRYSPQGQWLACGCDDHRVLLWETQTHQLVKTFEGHQNLVAGVAFSPDGQYLASASDDRTIRIWQVASGDCVQVLTGHQATVWTVAFSPDGQGLASGSFDQSVKLWNWQTGDCLHTLARAGGEVWSVAYIDEGRSLLSGSQDGVLTRWDVVQGTIAQSLCDQRPYEGMDITGSRGLTPAQRSTLLILGAVDHNVNA